MEMSVCAGELYMCEQVFFMPGELSVHEQVCLTPMDWLCLCEQVCLMPMGRLYL